jgi:hypothetical protein
LHYGLNCTQCQDCHKVFTRKYRFEKHKCDYQEAKTNASRCGECRNFLIKNFEHFCHVDQDGVEQEVESEEVVETELTEEVLEAEDAIKSITVACSLDDLMV